MAFEFINGFVLCHTICVYIDLGYKARCHFTDGEIILKIDMINTKFTNVCSKMKKGFTGKNCDEDRRPCTVKNPCKNGATCNHAKGSNGYSCNCKPGFKGTNCENDVRPCTVKKPCKNGGKCSHVGGSDYKCACPTGWSLKDNEVFIYSLLFFSLVCVPMMKL